jgi:hypothetical protein
MKIFMQITQNSIYDEFPWAKPVDLDFDVSDEGFFCEVMPWSFNQAQLKFNTHNACRGRKLVFDKTQAN